MKNIFLLMIVLTVTGCQLKYVVPEPAIDKFAPTSARAGEVVTIYGSCFYGHPKVTLANVTAQVTSVIITNTVNNDRIIFTVPPAAVTGKIKITTSGGTVVSLTNFVVIP